MLNCNRLQQNICFIIALTQSHNLQLLQQQAIKYTGDLNVTFPTTLLYSNYNKFLHLQSIMEQSKTSNQLKFQRERYSKFLYLQTEYYGSNSKQKYYKEFGETIQLFRQIFDLSKSQAGRTRIYEIKSSLVQYYLLQPIQVWWTRVGYWEVDNLILKILANLALDQRFFESVYSAESVLKDLIPRCYSKNFEELGGKVLANIKEMREKMRQKNKTMFKQEFSSKEEAIKELKNHKDLLNFTSSPYFSEQYPSYIGMLMGALRVGARQEVTHQFPKSCFGCVLKSMVTTGYQNNKKILAIKFLQQYTFGCVGQVAYEWILSKLRTCFNELNTNRNLTDRYQLVCLRFSQAKSTRPVYEFLSKFYSTQEQQWKKFRKTFSSHQSLELQCMKLSKISIIDKAADSLRSKWKQQSKKAKDMFGGSTLLSNEQAVLLRKIVEQQFIKKNYTLKKQWLKYRQESAYINSHLLSRIVNGYENQIYVIRRENGSLRIAIFIKPSEYNHTRGEFMLFDFNQSDSNFHHIATAELESMSHLTKIRKKGNSKEINKEERLYEMGEKKDIDQRQEEERRFYMRKFQRYKMGQDISKKLYRLSSKYGRYGKQFVPQEFSESEEEQEKQEPKKSTYPYRLVVQSRETEYQLQLKIKQPVTEQNQKEHDRLQHWQCQILSSERLYIEPSLQGQTMCLSQRRLNHIQQHKQPNRNIVYHLLEKHQKFQGKHLILLRLKRYL